MATKKKVLKASESEVKNEVKEVERSLHRSSSDRMIAGVAGGLAEYFGVDSSLVRVIFVLITLLGGSGVLAYIILWLILPSSSKLEVGESFEENIEEMKDKAKEWVSEMKLGRRDRDNKKVIGVILLVLGAIFLLQNMGWWFFDLGKLWPVFLIILGLMILIRRK